MHGKGFSSPRLELLAAAGVRVQFLLLFHLLNHSWYTQTNCTKFVLVRSGGVAF